MSDSVIYSDKYCGNKRLRIIEAAAVMFSQKGYYEAKIEEIAEQAGVGKGTIYEYFTSKKELFLEVFLHMEQKYQEMLKRELSADQSFHSRLCKMFLATMQFLSRHKEMARILFAENPPVVKDVHRVLLQKRKQRIGEISEMLQDAVERKEIRAVNTSVAAQLLLGALFSLGSQILFYEDIKEADYKRLAQEVAEMILQGLAVQNF